jgi:hypothetical protein
LPANPGSRYQAGNAKRRLAAPFRYNVKLSAI